MPILPEDGIAIRTGLMCRVSREEIINGKDAACGHDDLINLNSSGQNFRGQAHKSCK